MKCNWINNIEINRKIRVKLFSTSFWILAQIRFWSMDKYLDIHYRCINIFVFSVHGWKVYRHVEYYKPAPQVVLEYHIWSSIRRMCSFGSEGLDFWAIESFPIVKRSKHLVDLLAHPKTFGMLFCFSWSKNKLNILLVSLSNSVDKISHFTHLRSISLPYLKPCWVKV